MAFKLPPAVCTACGADLKLSDSSCKKCGLIFRDRIPNIDFWQTFWKIIESPGAALLHTVKAEKKNFVLPVAGISIIKLIIISNYLTVHLHKAELADGSHALLKAAGLLGVFLIGAPALRLLIRQLRYKDGFAIIAYAHLPLIISLLLLFIPEFVLFGRFLFLVSPSPFLFNPQLAVAFLILEALFILWAFFCFFRGLFYISGKWFPALSFAAIFYSALYFAGTLL